METLKLLALDSEDLNVISTHMQDAVICVEDMSYLPAENSFVMVARRFNWIKTQQGKENVRNDKSALERLQTVLRFQRVLGAQVQNLKFVPQQKALDKALALLSITYEPQQEPEGFITLTFSGEGAVRLHVECIEAELNDLGAAWAAGSMPEHKFADEDA
ncbi:MAG: DUF2948 family protein [Pseudomonadota bacterium]